MNGLRAKARVSPDSDMDYNSRHQSTNGLIHVGTEKSEAGIGGGLGLTPKWKARKGVLKDDNYTVILHALGRGKTVPHPSPFVLKLETWLRMADIPYRLETRKPMGCNGKMPWIEFNGESVTDSQLIIEFLSRKFGKDLWGRATVEERSIARSLRVMLEEHLYWGLVQWRFVQGVHTLDEIIALPGIQMQLAKVVLPRRLKKVLLAQGLGRYPYDDMVRILCDDLRDVSNLLGNNKFFLGNEPTEADAALFGFLAEVVWACPESPYEALIYNELINIKQYCVRMKAMFWPDWDQLLVKD